MKDFLNRIGNPLLRFFSDLFSEEDDPDEPFYDPAHLGAAVIGSIVVLGVLYWLLWTLLVYEGGIFPKIRALLTVAFTSKTLGDFGYEGYPYAMGVFEGWIGNLCALALAILAVAAVWKLYSTRKKWKQAAG